MLKYIRQNGTYAFFLMLMLMAGIIGFLPKIGFALPAVFILVLLKIRGHFNFNGVILAFVLIATFSIVLGDPLPFYKSWSRLGYFILMLLAMSPLITSKSLNQLRFQMFEWLMKFSVFVGSVSVPCYFLGVNYNSLDRETAEASLNGIFGGITRSSMYLGPLSGLAFCYLLYLWVHKKRNQQKITWWHSAAMFFSLASCLLAASRIALASLAAATAFIIFYCYKIQLLKKQYFILLIGVLGMFMAASLYFADGIMIKQQNNIQSGSMYSSRKAKWSQRMEEVKSHPGFGVGFAAQLKTRPVDRLTLRTGVVEPGSGWGAIAGMTGLSGMATILVLFATMFQAANRITKKGNIIGVLYGSLLIFFAIHFIGEGYVLAAGSPLCWMFWLTLGSICASYSHYTQPSRRHV